MATVPLGSKEGKWIMVATIMASAMAFIDSTALNVVLPSMQRSLNASGPELFWILNAYLLMLASLILIGGSLSDTLGRKKVFMLGIFIFILGSLLCGFAQGVTLLIVFRMIQGIGGALMIPGSLSLISSFINEKERGRAIGTWSSVTTMVTLGGPILGGMLGDAGRWRSIFFINIPIGVIALIILYRNVKERKAEKSNEPIDIWGALSITAALALISFGFLRIPVLGIRHWQVIASLLGGLALLGLFLVIERKGAHPMMPLRLFRSRAFSGTNLLTFFLYAGLGAGMLFLSLNLVQVQGYTQLQSGLAFLPFTVLMMLLARFAGSLADKLGARWFLIAGPAVAGLGLLLLSFPGQTHGAGEYWTTFFPGVLVLALGMSFTVAPLTATVMGSVEDRFSGTASGVNNAVTRIASVFANAIFGALAVLLFSTALKSALDHQQSGWSPAVRQAVMAQAGNLGNATAPAGINPEQQAAVRIHYHQSFLKAYQLILLLSSALCFTGALMALLFIGNVAPDTKT